MGTYDEGLRPQNPRRKRNERDKGGKYDEPEEPADNIRLKPEIPPYLIEECERVIRRKHPTISRHDLSRLLPTLIVQYILIGIKIEDSVSSPGTRIFGRRPDGSEWELQFKLFDL